MEIKNTDYKAFLQEYQGSKLSQVKNLTSKCDAEIIQIEKMIEDVTDYEIMLPNTDELSDLEKQIDEYTNKIEKLQAEIAKNQAEYAELHNRYSNGEITKEEFEQQSAEIDSRNKPLYAEISSCMNQQKWLQDTLTYTNTALENEAISLDDMKNNAIDELNYSEALVEVTNDKAEDLTKNSKSMKWLGFLTLGITTIIASVKDEASKKAKISSNNLMGLNNELKQDIEISITGEEFLKQTEVSSSSSLPERTNVETPESDTRTKQKDEENDIDNAKNK